MNLNNDNDTVTSKWEKKKSTELSPQTNKKKKQDVTTKP